jgi:hypothetical protein
MWVLHRLSLQQSPEDRISESRLYFSCVSICEYSYITDWPPRMLDDILFVLSCKFVSGHFFEVVDICTTIVNTLPAVASILTWRACEFISPFKPELLSNYHLQYGSIKHRYSGVSAHHTSLCIVYALIELNCCFELKDHRQPSKGNRNSCECKGQHIFTAFGPSKLIVWFLRVLFVRELHIFANEIVYTIS